MFTITKTGYSAGVYGCSALKDVDYIAFRTSLNDAEGDRWGCGECDTEYESEDEAEEYCKEE